MLNEAPKKQKKFVDYAHPTRWQLFWRVQKECWRRMVTPFMMYFFTSLIMLALQAISNQWVKLLSIVVCLAGGAFFNGHLCLNFGEAHYGAFVAGELHRRNELFGVVSGGDHRPEREYRPWKGFYIGFLIGLPIIILGIFSGAFPGDSGNNVRLAFAMIAGWAILPVTWLKTNVPALAGLSFFTTIAFAVIPIVVSGVFYILGAEKERKKREEENERAARVEEARKEAQVRVQTEEQRRKTLQSKKKK